MKINKLISLLQTSGINSKHIVIDKLNSTDLTEWLELRQDINELIRSLRSEEE